MSQKPLDGRKPSKKEIQEQKRKEAEIQQQQAAQVAKNDHTHRVAALINGWSDETVYAADNLPENFSGMVRTAFRHFSAMILHMPADTWIGIVSVTDNTYTAHQMDMLLQVLNMANAHHMDMDMSEFLDYKKMLDIVNGQFITYLEANKQRIKDENPFLGVIATAQA